MSLGALWTMIRRHGCRLHAPIRRCAVLVLAAFLFAGQTAAAADDPVITRLRQITDQVTALMAPYLTSGQVPPFAVLEQIAALQEEADTAAGGNATEYMRRYRQGIEAAGQPVDANTPPAAGNAPEYPVLYAALIRRDPDNLVLRGETLPSGQYSLFIPRDGDLVYVAFYDPRTKTFGIDIPRADPNSRYRMPRFNLTPAEDVPDVDQDGLPDPVEFVYGTDLTKSDTDGDGISDGAEVEQGTSPVGGLPTRTGVIATADTPGTAVDVCAVNDMAAVADSEAGVSVLNVFNGMNPTIIAQVDTPGSAQAIACAGGRIAIADGVAGLAIIDITDPPAARIVRQIDLGGKVQTVTVAGQIAFAGTASGRLAAVDLTTGSVIQEVVLAGAIHDLAVEADSLYVLLGNELQAYGLTRNFLGFQGKISVSLFAEGITGRRRVFVGGGIAYVSAYPGHFVIDVRIPASMVLLGSAQDWRPNSFKQIVANGSGLGVAAVGANPRNDGTHDVWLYDLSDPAQTTRFLTILPTPNIARSLSIYNGLAYVADSAAGLQVVNYLAYDAQGIPPTLTLSTNFAPGVAEEGQLMRVTALVSDDVQVRNVEFYVDGVKVLTDGNFPFEHRFVTPLISQQPTFTLRACATDTGGNRTCVDAMTITLTEDATAPQVTSVSPRAGSGAPENSVTAVSASFSEPIDTATLTEATFRLFSAGADGLAGTPDDVQLPGVLSYRDEINGAVLTFGTPLPIDLYRAVLSGSITDRKSNPLPEGFAWTFRVKAPNTWINTAGGRWHDPANWSEGEVPGPSDQVFITASGNYTVVVDRNTTVGHLTLGAPSGTQTLWISGNGAGGHITMTVSNGLVSSGVIRLESQTSSYASNLAVPGGTFLNAGVIEVRSGTGGARMLSGVLVSQGTVNLSYALTFAGSFTNTGAVNVASGAALSLGNGTVFDHNGGTLFGAGRLELSSATLNFNAGTVTGTAPFLVNSRLNLWATSAPAAFVMTGSASTVGGTLAEGQTLWISGNGTGGHTTVTTAPAGLTNSGTLRLESQTSSYGSSLSGTLTNSASGVIDVNQGTGGVRVISGTVTNQGRLNVAADLTLAGTATNTGTIDVVSGKKVSIGSGQVFNHNGGTVSGLGRLEFTGATMNFNGGSTSGTPPFLVNCRLNLNGATEPATLVLAGSSTTVVGTVAPGQTLWVSGQGSGGHTTVNTTAAGLTNAGTLRMESQTSSYASSLSGTLVNTSGGVINVNAGTGGARDISGSFANEGTLNVNYALGASGTFTNRGTVNIGAAQTLAVPTGGVVNHEDGTIAGSGELRLTSATFNFNGGTITGAPPLLINSLLAFATTSVPASFVMTGSGGLISGDIAAGQTLWVNGQGLGGHTTVTANAGFVNAGTILLESRTSSYQSNFVVRSGMLTNTGLIEVNEGTGGSRVFLGNLDNSGAVSVNYPLTADVNVTNTGTITIASGRVLSVPAGRVFSLSGGTIAGPGRLELSGATLNFGGGTTTGTPPLLVNSTLNFGGTSAPANFVMSGGSSKISGDIASGQTLWISGQGVGGHTTVTAAAGFTNGGTIRMESQTSSYASNLTVSSGTLVNAGLLEVNSGTGGARVLAATVENRGTVSVNMDLTVTGGSFQNAEAGTLRGTGTLSLSGATLANAGAVTPGTSPGILTVSGSLAQAPTGAVDVEIAGLTLGSLFDQLKVSSAASLDGTLNISLINGFVPNIGDSFDVLTYGSRTGAFATINGSSIGGGRRFQANYGTNKLTLAVVPE